MAVPEHGAAAVAVRVFTQDDFDRFAALTGDDNPIHVDPHYSAASRFGRPVAHGMFLYACLCGLLERSFPGAVQEHQDLMFPAPTFAGEAVTLRVEVRAVEGPRAAVAVEVARADGTVTCTGETSLRWEDP